jgi:hypothetical protein
MVLLPVVTVSVEAGLNTNEVKAVLLDPFLYTTMEYVRILIPSSAVMDIWTVVAPVAFSITGPDVTPLATILPSTLITALGSDAVALRVMLEVVADTEV